MSNMTNAAPHTPIQEADYSAIHPPSLLKRLELTNPVFWLSGSFLSLFVLLALTNTESLTAMVNAGFGFATKYFGAYWQVLLLLNFLIGLALAFGRTGYVRLGGLAKPDIDTFKWLSIVLCTLLAGGGVFWAAAEPIAHFVTAPPLYG
ncbi:BCCT family transporter, partial [Vibrio sp. 1974]